MDSRSMSYAQCVSVALNTLLEAARQNKIIPEPDPFQFLPRMSSFLESSSHRRKLAVTRKMDEDGTKFSLGARRDSHLAEAMAPAEPVQEQPEVVSGEQLRQRRRLGELVNKRDLVEQEIPGVLWSAEDQQEFDALYAMVYGN